MDFSQQGQAGIKVAGTGGEVGGSEQPKILGPVLSSSRGLHRWQALGGGHWPAGIRHAAGQEGHDGRSQAPELLWAEASVQLPTAPALPF